MQRLLNQTDESEHPHKASQLDLVKAVLSSSGHRSTSEMQIIVHEVLDHVPGVHALQLSTKLKLADSLQTMVRDCASMSY